MRSFKLLFILLAWVIFSEAQTPKAEILVVYHSLTGNTKQMAEAVAEGAKSVADVSVKLRSIKQVEKKDILKARAIIVGSPVHNANITPAMQRFINSWPFKGQPLKDKIGAAFVSAGGISAGEELAQMNILHSMLIYNMIVVGGPDWKSAFGASAITEENPSSTDMDNEKIKRYYAEKGSALGKRVAELTQAFSTYKVEPNEPQNSGTTPLKQ